MKYLAHIVLNLFLWNDKIDTCIFKTERQKLKKKKFLCIVVRRDWHSYSLYISGTKNNKLFSRRASSPVLLKIFRKDVIMSLSHHRKDSQYLLLEMNESFKSIEMKCWHKEIFCRAFRFLYHSHYFTWLLLIFFHFFTLKILHCPKPFD